MSKKTNFTSVKRSRRRSKSASSTKSLVQPTAPIGFSSLQLFDGLTQERHRPVKVTQHETLSSRDAVIFPPTLSRPIATQPTDHYRSQRDGATMQRPIGGICSPMLLVGEIALPWLAWPDHLGMRVMAVTAGKLPTPCRATGSADCVLTIATFI
jgi:hypothetical protein